MVEAAWDHDPVQRRTLLYLAAATSAIVEFRPIQDTNKIWNLGNTEEQQREIDQEAHNHATLPQQSCRLCQQHWSASEESKRPVSPIVA